MELNETLCLISLSDLNYAIRLAYQKGHENKWEKEDERTYKDRVQRDLWEVEKEISDKISKHILNISLNSNKIRD